MEILIIALISTLGIGYIIFLKYEYSRVNALEENIKMSFLQRSNLIPSFYEVTRNDLTMHSNIFSEILKLRKQEFSQVSSEAEMVHIYETKKQIHHELNFIFTTSVKHPKLLKDGKFIYIRELLLRKNAHISNQLEEYEMTISRVNKYISYKKFSVIGLFIPFSKKIPLH